MGANAKDWLALFKSSVVSLILLGLAVAVRKLGFDDPSIGLFTLLCSAFLIAFAITSGRLLTLSGPGGVSATFQSFFSKQADVVSAAFIGQPIDDQQIMYVAKRGLDDLPEEMLKLKPGDHAALVVKMGAHYDGQALREYESAMARQSKSVTIVIVDRQGRFVGSLRPSASGRRSQRDPRLFDRLAEYLASHDGTENDRRLPINIVSFPRGTTRKEALEYFVGADRDYLILVDVKGRPSSIVFLNEMLRDLLNKAEVAAETT